VRELVGMSPVIDNIPAMGKGPQRLSVLDGVVGLLASVVLACAGCGAPAAARQPLPYPGAGDVGYVLIQEPRRGLLPRRESCSPSGQVGARITMYEVADPDVTAALIDAHRRGVDTRVLLDAAFQGRATNTKAFDVLSAGGVAVAWAPARVTRRAWWSMTRPRRWGPATWLPGGIQRDLWLLDSNGADVAAIAETFDADVGAGRIGGVPAATAGPHLIWSPGARAAFIRDLDSASRSVDITSEELTDRAVIAAIEQVARRGVRCRIVMTQNQASAAAVGEVGAAGCSVHLLAASADSLYMHAKMLLIDDSRLVIGSQNLSKASLLENRELSLELDTTTAPKP